VGARPPRTIRTPRPARERSPLGRATLGLALIVAAAGALVDDANGGRMHPEQWLGLATVVCGVGLAVGAMRGHARWLVVPAVLLAGVGFASGQMARLDIPVDHAFGDRYLSIDSTSGATTHQIRRGFGDEYIWISDEVAVDHRVRAALVAGTITVSVPTDVRIVVDAEIDHGSLYVLGLERSETRVALGPEEAPTVTLDARVVIGDVRIEQYTYEPPPAADSPAAVEDAIAQGSLTAITDLVSVTDDGYVVLNGGQAVIDPDDRVVSSTYAPYDPSEVEVPREPGIDGAVATTSPVGAGTTGQLVIPTDAGEFRLLPRSLLLDPNGNLLDLRAIRQQAATMLPATSPPVGVTTLVPQLGTIPPIAPSTPRPADAPSPAEPTTTILPEQP
jgi:hypothetical protein